MLYFHQLFAYQVTNRMEYMACCYMKTRQDMVKFAPFLPLRTPSTSICLCVEFTQLTLPNSRTLSSCVCIIWFTLCRCVCAVRRSEQSIRNQKQQYSITVTTVQECKAKPLSPINRYKLFGTFQLSAITNWIANWYLQMKMRFPHHVKL